jgi:predicted DsbA family dithiol-disulfide isomerase
MTVTMSIALLILRLGIGLTLVGHGVQKLFGWFGGAGFTRLRQSFEKQGFKAHFAHREQVEVTWRSYQLDPGAPRDPGKPVNEVLAHKYGVPLSQAAAMNERVSAIAGQEGLEYHLEHARYGNTFDAHRLIQLAATHGLQQEAEERLFKAYFTEGRALGDAETLVQLVSELGIDADEALAVLSSDAYADEVRADEQRARAFGIQGVPFFAIDEKYGVSGAQPAELLREVLERAWAESYPLIQISSATQDEAGSCDGESCTIA